MICGIYQKEKLGSAREIAIKEDLELYEEINNPDRLISSLKHSPLLEISSKKIPQAYSIPQGTTQEKSKKKTLTSKTERDRDYLAKIKSLYP